VKTRRERAEALVALGTYARDHGWSVEDGVNMAAEFLEQTHDLSDEAARAVLEECVRILLHRMRRKSGREPLA
jgi:hypothetical protein